MPAPARFPRRHRFFSRFPRACPAHRCRGLAFGALALALTFFSDGARAEVRAIDSSHSHAQFSVRAMLFAHERGEFGSVHGELRSVDALRDTVEAWIDVGSLSMDDADALREASGPGFFDVENYPRIHFVSAPFPKDFLRDGGTLEGTLELHGVRRDATFRLAPSTCPQRPLACAVKVNGTLSRSAFGMHAHRGWLSDRVSLEMNILLRSS